MIECIPTEEQETTINYSRTDKVVDIWTSDQTVINKLDKLCAASPEFYSVVTVDIVNDKVLAKSYRISDKKMLSFRTTKVKVELTEEQRERRREIARNNFKK